MAEVAVEVEVDALERTLGTLRSGRLHVRHRQGPLVSLGNLGPLQFLWPVSLLRAPVGA